MGTTAATRPGWEVDLADDKLDWIRDVDNQGWWDRGNTIFLARSGSALYDIWLWVPARWVDRKVDRRGVHLFPEYVGPDLPVCEPTAITVARWYPGTSSPRHAYNARARDYVRTCTSLTCEQAKRQSVVALGALRETVAAAMAAR